MAQRMIHYLFGEILSRQIEIKDKDRFLIGSILPDAYVDGSERNITHFKYKLKPDNKEYFDFNKFREQYFELMQRDDLYLGYYMHLVEDAFYRQFLHSYQFKKPCNKEEVALLHNDYHILNSYIIEKYDIQNVLKKPFGFEQEPICKIATFGIDVFIETMVYDFIEKTLGETYFLTENMLDEFIEKYMVLGMKELQNILNGKCSLQAIDYAWS